MTEWRLVLTDDTCVIKDYACTRDDPKHLKLRHAPTLTDFLLARIEEDRVRATLREWHDRDCATIPDASGYSYPCECGVPERMVAECEAKRRIVEHARMSIRLSDETPDDGSPSAERIHGAATAWEAALEQMAAVYADHSDYRDEWRP